MTGLHGLGWERNPQVGFHEDEIRVFEQRKKDDSDKFLNQPISDRLLDYTYILDLLRVISDNWSAFAPIFHSRDTTIFYLETLNKFRNPVVHVRQVLLEHQYHLILGICGELLQYFDRWRAGYRHHIKSYSCEFRFLAFPAGDDLNPEAEASHKAREWTKKIENLSSKPVTQRNDGVFGTEKLIRLSSGQARISVPKTIPQHDDKSYWASIIQAEVHTKSSLNDILKEGEHPYWALYWNMRENIDVNALVSEINDLTGLAPISMDIAPVDRILSAEYSIPLENRKIRISITNGTSRGASASLGLIPERSQDVLFLAHEIFSPDDILSLLRGELSLPEFRAMAKRSTTQR